MAHNKKFRKLGLAILTGLGLLFGLLSYGAGMTQVSAVGPIIVNTAADELNADGDCSLREAIQAANTDSAVDACAAGSGADVISFTLTTPAVITLTLGELTISADPLTITGPGVALLAIDGNSAGRVFNITSNVLVTISGLAVRNGNTVNSGGGLNSINNVVLSGTVFSDNISGNDGGAINVQGMLTMTNTDVLSNTSAGDGGGIKTDANPVQLTGGRIENNASGSWAGGLYANGTLTISGTQFISNTAQTYSGAIFAWSNVSISNGLFERNTARNINVGGMFVYNNLVMTDTRFISNTANGGTGGIYVFGNARISGGEFAGNVAQGGTAGALNVDGALDIDGAQFTANRAATDGGALWYALDTIHISNATFAENYAGGSGGAINIQTPLIMTNTNFLSNSAAVQGGAVNASIAPVIISGGNFEENKAGLAGALFAGAAVTISGTQFISNSAQLFGGGVLAWQNISIANARFERNSARDYHAGALYLFGDGVFTATDFISNTAGQRYGAVWAGANVQMAGGTFAGNVAQNDAVGGMKVEGALTADGAVFSGNVSAADSGALDVRGNLTLTDTNVLSNTAAGQAGGVNSFGSDIRITGGAISFNTATDIGGGVRSDGMLTVSGTQFENNTASAGGAIDVANTGWFTGAVFTNNTASVADGGALNVSGSLWLTTTNFFGNQANANGGAVMVQGQTVLSDTEFSGNRALSGSGGAVHAADAVTVTLGVIYNNSAGDRGGGVYADGSVTMFLTDVGINAARNFGGGVFSWQSVDIEQSGFEYNGALVFSVGALYANGDATLDTVYFFENGANMRDGAVWVGGDATVIDSEFWDNRASGGRAGALDVGGSLWLTDTLFVRNQAATLGGALVLAGNGGRLVNALFARNGAGDDGNALYLAHSDTVELWHNTIAPTTMGDSLPIGNSAILVDATGSVAITDTILSDYGFAIAVTAGAVTEDYNLFARNNAITGTVMSGGHSVTGDPAFSDALFVDYHLKPGSWAINAGIVSPYTTDFEGNHRPGGGGVDIGFDETSFTSDAAIAKTVYLRETPAAGDPITFTLTFSNTGDSALYGLVITDAVPASITGTAFTAADAIVTDTGASPAYVWQVENLGKGAKGVITVTGTIARILESDTFTNTAQISTISPDADAANNISNVKIVVPNAKPSAADDTVATPEDTAVHISPLANDTDDNPLSVTGVGAPGSGSAVISGTDSIVYTPTLNFNGVDTFSYIVSDGKLTDTATITVTVTPVNDAPVAVDDTVLGVENTVIAVSPLGNDSDPENDPLSVAGVGSPAHGTAVISGTAIRYTPDTNFFGTDNFTYIVTDGVLTDTATVTVTVAQNLWFNYMPILFKDYTYAPDLVVSELIATENAVTVTIKNQGFAPVTDGFWVDVYIAPSPVPTQVNQIWSDVAAEGLVWGVDGTALAQLVPGGTLTLTIGDGLFDATKSNFSALSPGTPVYAQVDSVDLNTTYGGVLEIDELTGAPYNNIAGTTVGAGSSLLPTAQHFPPADEQHLPERQ